jgi:protein TonB
MALGKINIFDGNWVDLVFKGRNQNYGAYVLRKKSNEYTNKGVLFAIVFFTLAISAPMIVNYIKGLVPKDLEDVKVVEVNTLEEPPPVDKDQPPPPPVEPPPPLKSTVKFTPPEIKPDEEVPDEPPPTQDDMKDKDAGNKTVEGDPEGVDASLLESGDGLTGEEATEIVTFAEQMPEFPGGQEAMMAFLSKNIQYPPMARENGIEGRVVLQFVVDKDGNISNIEIVKKLGWGLEEEATRVVKTMPAWKPAKQNGKPVVLRMILPIVFKLQ